MRWGIVGTGVIALQFVADMAATDEVEIAGVYSRSHEKTVAFAKEHGIKKAYGSLDEMLADSEIEIVYIALPNNLHREAVIKAANAGKHILCEKPLGINTAEAREMFEAASQNDVVLMEGMWTRFFPLMCDLREKIARGEFGELYQAELSLGYNAIFAGEEASWRFNPESGFGALTDMGVYPVHFALDLTGGKMPDELYGIATVKNGIDYYNSFTMRFGTVLVSCVSSICNDTDVTARLYFEKGELVIAGNWWHPRSYTFRPSGEEAVEYRFDRTAEGLHYEAEAFQNYVKSGDAACALCSRQNTLTALTIMDKLRKDWGVIYPQD